MCGIAGAFFPKNVQPIDVDIDAMLGVISHRGPDGESRYISDDHRYQAGFKRLAIIDLQTGDQPIVENNGHRVLMGNGEIYNYLELRKSDVVKNYAYQTQGDMEVILPLAEKFGDDFLRHLNGMFALALFAQKSHRLFLARDRLGIKPLYWSKLFGGGILFASEVKALFASGLITREVDESVIGTYLGHGYIPAPRTLYKGVNKLAPGHHLIIDASGQIDQKRYWKATRSADLPSAPDDIAEHLTDLLKNSVGLQLRSDVPVGALLSGGIDSGLMVALAATQMSRPLQTYTVSFEGAAIDEAPLAALVAQQYGTEHTEISLSATTVSQYLPRLAWFCDEPVNDPALLPNFLIQEALGRHGKVALNGTGGDELFAGYDRYFQQPIEKLYQRLPAFARQSFEKTLEPLSPMTAWKLQRAAKFDPARGNYLYEHTSFFPPPMQALLGRKASHEDPLHASFYNEFDGPADTAALYADLNTYLPEDLLLLLDRTSMAFGVEGRVPYLDHRLVEAALAVPPEIRNPANNPGNNSGGQQKALLRKIARNYLPESITSAPKQGFASPVPAWFDAGLDTLAKRLLKRPASLERGWWTAKGVDSLLADSRHHAFRLYALVMLELTVRIHVEQPLSETAPNDDLASYADAA